MLMLPVGVALYSLAGRKDTLSGDEFAVFTVLGFALSMLYSAAVPILAVIFAVVLGTARTSPAQTGETSVYGVLAARPVPIMYAIAVIMLGLAMMRFELLPVLATLVKQARAGGLPAMALIGAVAVGMLMVIVFAARSLPRFAFGRVLFSGGGRMVLGWGLGVNVFILYSWAWGFGVLLGREVTYTPLLEWMLTWTDWMLVLPLLFAAGTAMVILSFTRRRHAARLRFLGVFVVTLVVVNMVTLPVYPDGRTIYDFGFIRYAAPALAGIPVVLLWLWEKSPGIRRIAMLVAVAVVVATWSRYAWLVRPVAIHEAELNRMVTDVVESYRRANPGAFVLCGDHLGGGGCGAAFTMKLYEKFHRSNRRNKPLPKSVQDQHVRTFREIACSSVRECLRLHFGQISGKVLFIGRARNAPPILANAGRPIHTPQPFPEPMVVRDIDVSAGSSRPAR